MSAGMPPQGAPIPPELLMAMIASGAGGPGGAPVPPGAMPPGVMPPGAPAGAPPIDPAMLATMMGGAMPADPGIPQDPAAMLGAMPPGAMPPGALPGAAMAPGGGIPGFPSTDPATYMPVAAQAVQQDAQHLQLAASQAMQTAAAQMGIDPSLVGAFAGPVGGPMMGGLESESIMPLPGSAFAGGGY